MTSGSIESRDNEPKKYIEASFNIPREIHDAVCNFIVDNYGVGLVLDEKEDSPDIGITFYLPEYQDIDFQKKIANYINIISSDTNFLPEHISIKPIENYSWVDKFRESVKPVVIENTVVRPPWYTVPFEGKLELIIEPKMAFGTGTHETTKLCISQIIKNFKPGQNFFDLGCGSGILAILAAKLGGVNIKGVDTDLVAVENARENIEINGVKDRVTIEHGSIEKARFDRRYEFLAANIIKSTIIGLLDDIFEITTDNATIILSGLLVEDQKAVEKALSKYKIKKYEINRDGQWLAVTIHNKS